MSRRNGRVIEVAGRIMRHSDSIHDRARPRVVWNRIGDDFREIERRTAPRAASVAYPCPHMGRANLQPISTAGVNAAMNETCMSPTKPANRVVPGISSAQKPKPRLRK